MGSGSKYLLALLMHLGEQLVRGPVPLQPLYLVSIGEAEHELHGHFARQQQALAELLRAKGYAACQGPEQQGMWP